MEKALILETTFLIDLERELARASSGPAQEFLKRYGKHRLCLTYTIAGEIAAGLNVDDRERWERFLSPFRVLSLNLDVCWEYGKVYQYLRSNGLVIGANDLWIAATALAYRMPVVTSNVNLYRRVPGLRVLDYAV